MPESFLVKRDHYLCPQLGGDSSQGDDTEDRYVVDRDADYNLIGSTVGVPVGWHPYPEAVHMPVLDIDHMCHLYPSETEGHFHLYIDVPISWEDYEKVLAVLGEVGILEPGYVSACKSRKASFVAPFPWKHKEDDSGF